MDNLRLTSRLEKSCPFERIAAEAKSKQIPMAVKTARRRKRSVPYSFVSFLSFCSGIWTTVIPKNVTRLSLVHLRLSRAV